MRKSGRRFPLCFLGLAAAGALAALDVAPGLADTVSPAQAKRLASEPMPVAPAALAEKGMEVAWHLQLTLTPGTRLTHTWLRGDYLVCLGSDNRLYTVDASSGVLLWSERVAEPFQSVYPPAVYKEEQKDYLCVATTTKLLVYRAADGRLMNTVQLDFAPSGGVAANGFFCYIPATDGWVHAVALLPKTMSWGRWTDRTMTAAPVLDSNSLFFASQNGTIYSCAQNARRIAWQYQTGGPVVADLKRTRSGLILGASLDYSLYAIAGSSGRLAWRFDSGEPVAVPPCTNGNQVFVLTEGAMLNVLDETTGQVQWKLPGASAFVGSDPDTVYIRGAADFIGAARADGTVRFRIPCRSDAMAAVNETDSALVYLGTPQGLIQTVAPKNRAEIVKPAAPVKEVKPVAPPPKPATEAEKPAEGDQPAAETPPPPPPAATKPATPPPKPATAKTPPPPKEKPAPPPPKEPKTPKTPVKRGAKG